MTLGRLYFFVILGIMELKGNTYLTQVLQLVPCEGVVFPISPDNAADIKKNAGVNYRMMNEAIRNVLDNLKANHPAYDSNAGYEIAGFVWFQGYNDQFSPEYRGNYKDNMMNNCAKSQNHQLKVD